MGVLSLDMRVPSVTVVETTPPWEIIIGLRPRRYWGPGAGGMTPPASMAPEITSVRLMDNAGTMTWGLEARLVSSLGILIANLGMVNFRYHPYA